MNTRIASPVRNLLASAGLLACAAIAAAQSNPTVVNGQASFARQGSVYSITNTPGTILQWPGFSIAAGETTRFIQQSANSAVLNRITGQDPSLILGTLQSNGRVFLVNPNGVLFGAGARVDVNGLVASSLGISNADFLAGKLNFSTGDNAGAGRVANQGRISTPTGGRVLLIAPHVENSGLIQAPGGEVVLAAGRSVQLADSSNPELQVVLSAPQDQAVNLGQVLAHSGRVGIYGALVNQRGVVNADSATIGEGGKIIFKASGDLLLEAGSQTSAAGAGKGGTISLSGDRVGLTGNAQVDASGQAGGGTVLAGSTAASQLFISSDAAIRADALGAGDGGKVLALSGGVTRIYGQLSARGGAASGNGGFIETSGATLAMDGKADTRAPHGKTGQLLLDPTNIYIAADAATAEAAGMEAGSPMAEGASTFVANGPVQDSLMRVSTLNTFLGLNNVTVSTENASGTGAGTIYVVSPFQVPEYASLTLFANAGIRIDANITGLNGSTVDLHATGGDILQSAPISVQFLSARADGGSVNLGANNFVGQISGSSNTAGGFTFVNGGYLTVGNINAGAGGPINLSAATLNVTGNVSTSGSGAINLNAPSLIHNGNVTAVAGDVVLSGQYPDLQEAETGTAFSTSGRVTVRGQVLRPSLNDCVANSAAPNCNLVLPSLAACQANAALPGCSVVLPPAPPPAPPAPTLATCVAAPTTAGCADVLPGLGVCIASPTIPGCLAVLPSLSVCVSAPGTAGCSAVLPGIAICTGAPSTAGCSVVLPSLNACSATPSLPGCTAVLPTLGACVANPTAAGCSVVLPTLQACTASPAQAGCSVVLPSLVACVANPGAAGCSVVLPSLAQCTVTPTLGGCSAILPSLSSCVAVPSNAGCAAVLPSLAQCVAAPSAAGCSAVLPTLSACTSTPTVAGCSAVLPTLAQCTGSPTLQGCTAVLPPVSACVANPSAPGCVVVIPPTQQANNTPVGQALNDTVNAINTANQTTTPPPVGGSAGSDKAGDKSSDKSSDLKQDVASTGVKETPKKTYCN